MVRFGGVGWAFGEVMGLEGRGFNKRFDYFQRRIVGAAKLVRSYRCGDHERLGIAKRPLIGIRRNDYRLSFYEAQYVALAVGLPQSWYR